MNMLSGYLRVCISTLGVEGAMGWSCKHVFMQLHAKTKWHARQLRSTHLMLLGLGKDEEVRYCYPIGIQNLMLCARYCDQTDESCIGASPLAFL